MLGQRRREGPGPITVSGCAVRFPSFGVWMTEGAESAKMSLAPPLSQLARQSSTDAAPLSGSRLLFLAISWLYALAIAYAHRAYLSYDWAYVGFDYSPPGPLAVVGALGLISLPIATMPKVMDRPSALILFLLYAIVDVPATIIGAALRYDSFEKYWPILAAMCAVFVFAGVVTQRYRPTTDPGGGRPVEAEALTLGLIALWVLTTIIIIAAYRSIMSFASYDQVYEQRFAVERSISALGYIRIYHASVFSPALISIGLVNRRLLPVVMGIAGCIISYMVDAQKTTLVMPALIGIVYLSMSSRATFARSLAAATGFMLALVVVSLALRGTGPGDFLSSQLIFRTIAIPGLSVMQYYDLFGQAGYTWWSNITGISLIVPPPAAFASDPYWPALGEIVGRAVYGAYGEVNANASMFAGEGAAAAGWIGILVIGVVMTLWLRLLDYAATNWNRTLVILLVVPIGISLTNVHLSTVLMSFGGGLLTVLLMFYKPRRRRT